MSETEKPRNPIVDNMKFTKAKSKDRKKFNKDLDQEVDLMSNLEIEKYIHNLGQELESNKAEGNVKVQNDEQLFTSEVAKTLRQMQQID